MSTIMWGVPTEREGQQQGSIDRGENIDNANIISRIATNTYIEDLKFQNDNDWNFYFQLIEWVQQSNLH